MTASVPPKTVSAAGRLLGGLFCFLALAAPAGGWGPVGHSEVNADAVEGLPTPLFEFFDRHADVLADHASDPDDWKSADKAEGPRHYIDIDGLMPYPFEGFPADFEDAIARFGKARLEEHGLLPWRIAEYTEKLSADFKAGRWSKVPLTAAHLGHYVGDLHQPLHTTLNHDGEETGNDGVHMRFEDEMLNIYEEFFYVDVRMAARVEDPAAFALEAIRSGYPGVKEIMDADAAADEAAGNNEELYYQKLYEKTWTLVNRRLSDASAALASLIYTAWLNAGSPAPPDR